MLDLHQLSTTLQIQFITIQLLNLKTQAICQVVPTFEAFFLPLTMLETKENNVKGGKIENLTFKPYLP